MDETGHAVSGRMVFMARYEDFGQNDSRRIQRLRGYLKTFLFQNFKHDISHKRGRMRIAVIGSGYVGLVSAACFAEIGHDVITVDNDEAKIAKLERGEVPIHDEYLPSLLAKHHGKLL